MKKQIIINGHPLGLYVLFAVEMCERFSYYGMKAILLLCLQASKEVGGFELSILHALTIYKYYASLCYMFNPIGGYLARIIGDKQIVCLGGFILVAGHIVLAIHNYNALIIGLSLVIIGVNLLKPNISTLMAKQYDPNQQDKINAAMYLFYRGINIGAFLGSFIVGYVGCKHNYQIALFISSLFMFLGQAIYLSYYRFLTIYQQDKINDKEEREESNTVLFHKKIGILITILIIFIFTIAYEEGCSSLTVIVNQYMDNKILGYSVPIPWYHTICNPAFIMIFASIINNCFEIFSSFTRLGFGLLFSGVSFIPIVFGAMQIESGQLMSQWFYIIQQLICTIGELLVYTLGISFVTRLAPNNEKGFYVGLLYTSMGIAAYIAIQLYSYIYTIAASNVIFFTCISIINCSFGILIILIAKHLQKLIYNIK